MNHIITGDERNVKNLETKVYMVYVSWGMSFNDGQISSQKVNLNIHCYPTVTEVTPIINIQKGELSAATCRGKAPCTLGGGTRGFPLGYNSEAI